MKVIKNQEKKEKKKKKPYAEGNRYADGYPRARPNPKSVKWSGRSGPTRPHCIDPASIDASPFPRHSRRRPQPRWPPSPSPPEPASLSLLPELWPRPPSSPPPPSPSLPEPARAPSSPPSRAPAPRPLLHARLPRPRHRARA